MPEPIIRTMEPSDLSLCMVVQSECYTEIEPESYESLDSKLQLSPDSCWVADLSGEVVAYLICHPWEKGAVPALNAYLESLPEDADLFYIHDLAVSPRSQGLGLGRLLVQNALSFASNAGFECAGLIAVQGSTDFWASFGFASSTLSTQQGVDKLLAYGDAATYMESRLLSDA